MEYRKYKFSSNQWVSLRPLILDQLGCYVDCEVVDLGLEINTPEVVNIEGDVIVPATYTDNVRVDILWHITPLSQFIPYEVWPIGGGVHMFAGLDDLYENCYNNRN